MKIFRAIGLGLAIIILRFLMPDLFRAFESVLLEFFNMLSSIISLGTNGIEAGMINPANIHLIPRIN